MDFDREAAKAAGYTDAEIDSFLAGSSQPGAAESRLVEPSLMERIGPYAAGAGAVGLGAGGVALARKNPRLAKIAGKFAAKQVPGLGPAIDVYDAAKDMMGPRKATAPQPTHPSEERIREARADLAERRLMPKESAPADRTTTKRTPKPKPRTKQPPAKIPERVVPIKVSGKPKAVRLAKQRGVSKREIASRQKGMAASRIPAGGDDMMEQLARSVESEAGLTKLGVVPGATLPSGRSMRGAVRSGMRGNALPGALSLLLSLLDAGSIPEQMDEAAAITRPAMNPELARILAQQRTIY